MNIKYNSVAHTSFSVIQGKGRWFLLGLAALLLALFSLLAGCGAPTSLAFSPCGPEYQEDLFPSGASMEVSIGEERSIVLHGGQCMGLSHKGISVKGGSGASLKISLKTGASSDIISRIGIKLPTEPGILRFPEPGEAREFVEVGFLVEGKGPGIMTIHAPQFLRAVPVDDLGFEIEGGRQPDVIFIMIDTLRKDRLGCYGSDRGLTPGIDALSRESIVFDDAIAQSPWTRPSVASMFTGLPPYEHGVVDRDDALPDTAWVLPERLKEAGYETGAVITNGNVCAKFGFNQGFDQFLRAGGPAKTDGSRALKLAKEMIDKRDQDRPFFLYLHLSDPHAPYHPPENWSTKWAPGVDLSVASRDALRDHRNGTGLTDELRAQIISLYDGEVAFVDHLVGDLIGHLKEQGMYDSSFIVLVADHGEEFWTHGIWGHGGSLYPALLEVPFMLKLPGMSQGLRTERMAEHIDLLPTILSLAGLPLSPELRGVDLTAKTIPLNRIAFSSINKAGLAGVSLTTGDWKLIEARSGLFRDTHGAIRLFDRNADPGEISDISGKDEFHLHLLKGLMLREQIGRHRMDAKEVAIRGELRKELEALGYIEPGEILKESTN